MKISKVYIFHPYLEKPGGGTLVALSFAYYFWRKNIPVIYICSKYSKEKLIKFFGEIFDRNFLESLIVKEIDFYLIKKFKFPATINLILFKKYIIEKFIVKEKIKQGTLYIISNPWSIYIDRDSIFQYLHAPVSVFYLLHREKVLTKKFYRLFLLALNKMFCKYNRKYYEKYFVNSNFIATLSDEKYNILYPPVFIKDVQINKKDKNLVVSLQRFSPGKNIELILELAKEFPENRFIIMGTVSYVEYFKKLKYKIKNENIRNVKLLPNISRKILEKYLSLANIYLHTMFGEPFGISVVEAMSYGCIPIVPKFSGSYYDIIDKGKFGLGYKDFQELIKIFENKSWKIFENKRDDIKSRAKYFNFKNFETQLNKIFGDLI